jgi:hypothetical protein
MLHIAIATEPLISEERDGTVKPKNIGNHCYADASKTDKPDAKS